MAEKRGIRALIKRFIVGAVLVGSVLFAITPAPYVIEMPGPVFNALGSLGDKQIVTVVGAKTYATDGQFDVLTVQTRGTPEGKPSWVEVLLAMMNSDVKVVPIDEIYPPGSTQKDQEQETTRMMLDSQRDAIAVALKKSGYKFKSWLAVDAVISGRPADGLIKPDDILKSVNSIEPHSLKDVTDQIEKRAGKAVDFQIIRDGKPKTVSVTPFLDPQSGHYRVGMQLGFRYDFPIDVKVDLGDVTGPSAGLTFTLGVIDTLDARSLTSGNKVAATGTIGADGSVGAIGGVQLKMKAALASGAKFMLAPVENCNEIVGHIPAGLQVVAVSNIDEALAALEQLRVQKKPPTSTKLGCPTR